MQSTLMEKEKMEGDGREGAEQPLVRPDMIQSTLARPMDDNDAELAKMLSLVSSMLPIATGVRIKRLSQSDILRHTRHKKRKNSDSTTTTAHGSKVKVKNSTSPDDLTKKMRLEKTKKMAEVIARDQQRNDSHAAKKAYNFSYSAKTPSLEASKEEEPRKSFVGKIPKRTVIEAPAAAKTKDDFNIKQLLDNPFKTPEPNQPHCRIRAPNVPPPRIPPASSPSPAASTAPSPATNNKAEAEPVPVKAAPPPLPRESTCADEVAAPKPPPPPSDNISEDLALAVPLPSHLKNRKACWFCPICDHFDAKEEHSQRSVENHVHERHLRCFLDVDDFVCFLCKEDMENTRSLLAHWVKKHPRHFEQVLTLNGHCKKELSPLPYDRGQCAIKVKCLRCASHFSDMRYYWVHLAVEHYADIVVPEAQLEAKAKTATKCFFEGCTNTFLTRVAMIAHMAAAHELMQKYIGTMIDNDLYKEID